MQLNDYIDCERLDNDIDEYSKKYQLAKPFPNIVIDNFLKKDSIYKTLKGYEKLIGHLLHTLMKEKVEIKIKNLMILLKILLKL